MAKQFNWKTQELKDLISAKLPDVKIEIDGPGGDYDTETLVLNRKGAVIYLCGWRPENPLSSSEAQDGQVDFLMLNDDQKEGLFTSNKPTVTVTTLYSEVLKVLEDQYGKSVTITSAGYKDFF